MTPCKHCGQPIRSDNGTTWIHEHNLNRCRDERLEYGYNAAPEGVGCDWTCNGYEGPNQWR